MPRMPTSSVLICLQAAGALLMSYWPVQCTASATAAAASVGS